MDIPKLFIVEIQSQAWDELHSNPLVNKNGKSILRTAPANKTCLN